jgi:hypothetical protein
MYAALGDTDRALAWLERAFAEQDDEIVWIAVEPWYEPLRDDVRFRGLLERIGLHLQAVGSPASTRGDRQAAQRG